MTSEDLRERRVALKMTQQQIGLLMGFSTAHARKRIYEFETKRKKLAPATSTAFDLLFEKLEKENK